MSKNEFLKKLKSALEVDLSQSQINEQIAYYDNYITTEVKNGRSEQDVLDELGDPNLIAKTIKQVSPDSNVNTSDNSYSYNNNSNYSGNYDNDNNESDRFKNIFGNGTYRQYTGGTASCLIIGLIIFFIFYMVLSLLGRLLYGGLYLAAYYPAFLLVIVLIIYLINKGRNR